LSCGGRLTGNVKFTQHPTSLKYHRCPLPMLCLIATNRQNQQLSNRLQFHQCYATLCYISQIVFILNRFFPTKSLSKCHHVFPSPLFQSCYIFKMTYILNLLHKCGCCFLHKPVLMSVCIVFVTKCSHIILINYSFIQSFIIRLVIFCINLELNFCN